MIRTLGRLLALIQQHSNKLPLGILFGNYMQDPINYNLPGGYARGQMSKKIANPSEMSKRMARSLLPRSRKSLG